MLLSLNDMFNIFVVLGAIVLWIVRWPKTKEYQMYAFGEVKPLYFAIFAGLVVGFYLFFSFIFSLNTNKDNINSRLILNNGDISISDELDMTQPSSQTISIITGNVDYDRTGANDDTCYIQTSADMAPVASADGFALESCTYYQPIETYLVINIVPSDTKIKNVRPSSGSIEYAYSQYEPLYSQKLIEINIPMDEGSKKVYEGRPLTYKDALDMAGIEFTKPIELEREDLEKVKDAREAMLLPFPYALIPMSLLLASLIFHFVLFSKAIVKQYLQELYTINKFCGFLSYNMSYRSNAKVLVEDTLSAIDDGQFKDDFALIFFEKDRTIKEKMSDITNIYTFKFLEMYLGIAAIVFEEGPSESTMKSMQIIQVLGDEYYNQADLFFRTKAGAMSSIYMIAIISALIPAMVKINIGSMYVYYVNSGSGFVVTLGFYLVMIGIFVMVNRIYVNHKIIRKEGRYV